MRPSLRNKPIKNKAHPDPLIGFTPESPKNYPGKREKVPKNKILNSKRLRFTKIF